MDYTYSVKVIDRITSKTVKSLDAVGLNKARKLKSALEINLNHDKYFVKLTKQD